jgi:hypothetical protein
MNLVKVRRLLAQGRVVLRFIDHAIIEGRKDGLTSEDLEETVFHGEIIEDYGIRGLLLHFTRDDGIPCHIMLEYVPGTDEASVVTAYVPDAKLWQPNWKRRRQKKRK